MKSFNGDRNHLSPSKKIFFKIDGIKGVSAFYTQMVNVKVKYNQYDIEDFLSDKDFILWVKQKNDPPSFFFEKWLNSNPPNKEKALLARELLLSLKPDQLEASQSEFYEVLNNLMKFDQHEAPVYTIRPQPIIWLRYAAIILLAFTFTFILKIIRPDAADVIHVPAISYVVKENPPGQRSQIRLPDGSLVHLNASSKLTYADNFGQHGRDIELSGEAFFDVKEKRQIPFTVKTGDIYTKVLGTSFNIATVDPEHDVAITVMTGKVEIGNLKSDQFPTTWLTPGEKAIVSEGEIRKSSYEYKDIAWKEGVIVFEQASLEQVVQTLQRWYGVTIKVENAPADTWLYTGKFNNTSLEITLERMSYTQRFSYELANDFITLKFSSL